MIVQGDKKTNEDGKLLEAKEVYFFNKQIQNILNKKLQEML